MHIHAYPHGKYKGIKGKGTCRLIKRSTRVNFPSGVSKSAQESSQLSLRAASDAMHQKLRQKLRQKPLAARTSPKNAQRARSRKTPPRAQEIKKHATQLPAVRH